MGCDPSAISHAYKKAVQLVIGQMEKDLKPMIFKVWSTYEEIKREAWAAWERSKEDSHKEVTVLGGEDGGERTTVTREGRLPNNTYLMTIGACLSAQREMFGMDAPKRVEHSGKVDVGVVDWDSLAKMIPEGALPDRVEEEIEKVLLSIESKDVEVRDVVPMPPSNGTGTNGDVPHNHGDEEE